MEFLNGMTSKEIVAIIEQAVMEDYSNVEHNRATKEDWEDFWKELETSEEESFEETWKKMDEIEPLTPKTN